MAIKFLIAGTERSGKTTLTSKIEDVLIVSFDVKKYPYKVPHVNFNEYTGMSNVIEQINEKIVAFEEKMGHFPKTIVFDTVTAMYTRMNQWANGAFSGFSIHSAINNDTLAFNTYIEDELLPNGVNVVIVAHTIFDKGTEKFIVPATGAFEKSGSWLGSVDEASYVEIKSDKFYIHHKNLKFPCRSTVGEELPKSEKVDDYDINKHIDLLTHKELHNSEYEI